MRRALFVLWVMWLTLITLIFAPVTIMLSLIVAALGLIVLIWGHIFNVLTLGIFQ